MVKSKISSALAQYDRVGKVVDVDGASPHRLIQMLMEGAVTRIASAEGYMRRGETARKGEQIGLAISIIDGLRGSLDMDRGGEIAVNLERLYDYMMRRLVHANAQNDAGMLEEVRGLLRQVKEAWDAIGDSAAGTSAEAAGSAPLPSAPQSGEAPEVPAQHLSIRT